MKRRVFIYMIICLSLINTATAQLKGDALIINDKKDYVNNTLIKEISIATTDFHWCRLFNYGGKIYIPYMYRDSEDKLILSSNISTPNIKRWIENNIEVMFEEDEGENICFANSLYGRYSFPHYIFYGRENMNFNHQQGFNSEWTRSNILTTTLNHKFSVVGSVCDNSSNRHTIIYNSEDINGVNHVFCTTSYDNGRNWGLSAIAVKHNIEELRCWSIAQSDKDNNSCFMVLSNKEGEAYYTISNNKGLTWSYPTQLPLKMRGTDYKLFIRKGHMIVLFKAMDNNRSGEYNDIFIWRGGNSLNRDKELGKYIKLFDNQPNSGSVDISVEDIVANDSNSCYVLLRKSEEDRCNLELHFIDKIKFKKTNKKQIRNK